MSAVVEITIKIDHTMNKVIYGKKASFPDAIPLLIARVITKSKPAR